jgi:hypothetical protein
MRMRIQWWIRLTQGQPFLWINILRWREIFRDCQESGHPSLLPKFVRGRIALQKRFARKLTDLQRLTLPCELLPADLSAFVLFFQRAHERLVSASLWLVIARGQITV